MSKSTQQIKIEKGIPLPQGKIPPLPLDVMKVGDSFALSLTSVTDKRTVRQRLSRFQKNNLPKRFSMRTMGDGNGTVRVYRIEDY